MGLAAAFATSGRSITSLHHPLLVIPNKVNDMPATDSPAIIVARFLKANGYNEVR